MRIKIKHENKNNRVGAGAQVNISGQKSWLLLQTTRWQKCVDKYPRSFNFDTCILSARCFFKGKI